MCNLYSITTNQGVIYELFKAGEALAIFSLRAGEIYVEKDGGCRSTVDTISSDSTSICATHVAMGIGVAVRGRSGRDSRGSADSRWSDSV
jgi:hypothetical protein